MLPSVRLLGALLRSQSVLRAWLHASRVFLTWALYVGDLEASQTTKAARVGLNPWIAFPGLKGEVLRWKCLLLLKLWGAERLAPATELAVVRVELLCIVPILSTSIGDLLSPPHQSSLVSV